MRKSLDSLQSKKTLKSAGKEFEIFDIQAAAKNMGKDISKMPFSMKILLENLLRNEDGVTITRTDIEALFAWLDAGGKSKHEIAYYPTRVLMQDFTGVPAVVDLAAMRDAMKALGGDANKINPLTPVDLVIDHSIQVDHYGAADAFTKNVQLEMERNNERYEFLRWGQNALANFRVVPPGTGICHQVNLEYLAKVVWTKQEDGRDFAYLDSLVGTDSHTTMINGLGVLGWGVGGIEAEAVMLGQSISMIIPEVVGFKITGQPAEGVTATDIVLTVTQMLRKHGVVDKFVEFYGQGVKNLQLADRATIANMAPEYGATCGLFPIDEETVNYLRLSGRDESQISLVEDYSKLQGFWYNDPSIEPVFTSQLNLDLSEVKPSLAGPKRPQDKVVLAQVPKSFADILPSLKSNEASLNKYAKVDGADYMLGNGDVVIAAITSCTNTSNPNVMIAAGLVAKNAAKFGLKAKAWVKTSLAPGSKVVLEYLQASNLIKSLEDVGFNLVGYGCTTCIGNSGPLRKELETTISENNVAVASVLSGNRNFEGRVHPLVKANYLASPPLVVAYSILGNVNEDITQAVLGKSSDGKDIYLRDIWPTTAEVKEAVQKYINSAMFKSKYADVFLGEASWQAIHFVKSLNYNWNASSTYIKNPPYFEHMKLAVSGKEDVQKAAILALFGDSITTDHISPAGNIAKTGPAGRYLQELAVSPQDFNSYGARRGNHEVMMRGTFANVRIKNEMLGGKEGGLTICHLTKEEMSIYDAAMAYGKANVPLIVVAGKEYGTGSSRDWAAKGTLLLGVKAVIAESFERIHRSNLIGMGVLPLIFASGENRTSLNLKGDERLDISGLSSLTPKCKVKCTIHYSDNSTKTIELICGINTETEIEYFLNGGVLHYTIRKLSGK